MTTPFQIKNRFTGAVQFECELGAELDAAANRVKLGAAIKAAINACANLADADLADADLARANLARANLAGADLAGANLAGANLAGANLARANLACANLARANLARADLVGADLVGANLARANLARANLARANLARADLVGADLVGANLARANDVINAGTPNNWRAVGWRCAGVLRVRVGCHDFSLAEGRKYWDAKPDRREVLAALDYIEAVARLREWKEAGQ